MIIGDAGYGCLILIATIALVAKTKKFNTTTYLLLVLVHCDYRMGCRHRYVVWYGKSNACTFLKSSGHSSVCKYPEYFGVSAVT